MLHVLADAYLHRLDPFAIQFTESFGLRWYGLSYAAGFLLGWWMMRWIARTGRSSLTVESVGDLMFYVIAGVLVGGRVGYAAFYDPALFIDFDDGFPFWGLLALTKGGMASHGGMIGVIAACYIFAWRRRISATRLLDAGAFVSTPGLCLGRLANFVFVFQIHLFDRHLDQAVLDGDVRHQVDSIGDGNDPGHEGPGADYTHRRGV